MPFDPRARTAHRTARRGRHGHRSRPRRERTAERTRRRTGGQRRRIDGIMATNDALGPFRAGPGSPPPYLAGREAEQAACRAFLNELRNERPPPREIVFYGPRGNGKTALLVWLQKEAASRFGLDVIRLTPAAARTEARLVERLLPASWWRRFAPDRVSVSGLTWRPGEERPPPLDAALPRAPRRSPWCWCSTKPIPWRTRSEGRC